MTIEYKMVTGCPCQSRIKGKEQMLVGKHVLSNQIKGVAFKKTHQIKYGSATAHVYSRIEADQ
jgi:hypothetical protein